MDQRVEPMEVEEVLTDAYNFDEIIDSELKHNDSKRLNPREVLTVSGAREILTESRKRTHRQTTLTRRRSKGNLSDEDEKGKSKNPWGDLSQTWGVNDTLEEDFIQKFHVTDQANNVKERLGSKNRPKDTLSVSEECDTESESDSEEEWCRKSKVLRMRMHADDEEKKMQKRRSKSCTQLTISTTNDLRMRLGRLRKKPVRAAIQIVVTNPAITHESSKADASEEEEGEILDSENEDQQMVENNEESEEEEDEEENEDEGVEEEDVEEEGEVDSDHDSEVSKKEVRGPKGSVIKVVTPKPRIASTVWARLNHKSVKSEVKAVNNSEPPRRDLRETLREDLRSRLGKYTRGRSPLRIEVKNDKCADEQTDSE
ncbi:glutamic acid-rich protein-like [Belonocnema kinseyi]|uniref:glutamic acid-rich protein-like n=1 Tax=Belonocnema kinseyi TaxID=2817044 RepID=UPI00143DE62F|nr:glutamic acid-rich protein-like [Belonocnema kinseyi]